MTDHEDYDGPEPEPTDDETESTPTELDEFTLEPAEPGDPPLRPGAAN